MRLIAMMPGIVASYHRQRTGQTVIDPDPQSGHAANFLRMLLGEEPDEEAGQAMNVSFVLYADHTMNASTFTARIIASTLADMFSAITGAIGCLKGPLHGGANEESMKMLEEVDKPENAAAYVADRLERKEKIFGFGHAVYKTMDPRARIFKRWSRRVPVSRHGDPKWFEISEAIEEATLEQKGLYPNVDFYAASVYHVLGIPTDLMTPIFAARTDGRVDGARARAVRRQQRHPPCSEYIGPRNGRTSRSTSELVPHTGAVGHAVGRGNRPAPSTTVRTRSSRPIPMRWTPATPGIPRSAFTMSTVQCEPDLASVVPGVVQGSIICGRHPHARQSCSCMNRACFALRSGTTPDEHLRPLEQPPRAHPVRPRRERIHVIGDLRHHDVGAGVELRLQPAGS